MEKEFIRNEKEIYRVKIIWVKAEEPSPLSPLTPFPQNEVSLLTGKNKHDTMKKTVQKSVPDKGELLCQSNFH